MLAMVGCERVVGERSFERPSQSGRQERMSDDPEVVECTRRKSEAEASRNRFFSKLELEEEVTLDERWEPPGQEAHLLCEGLFDKAGRFQQLRQRVPVNH